MKIEKFEDIKAWQESRQLVKSIYKLAEKDKRFNTDYRLKSQITSAATSIMSNIAEGFSRMSNKEFKQFLYIAKGSVAEVQSQLYILLDLNYISKGDFTENYSKLDKTARLISKFITYLTQQTQKKTNSTNSTNPINSKNSITQTGGLHV